MSRISKTVACATLMCCFQLMCIAPSAAQTDDPVVMEVGGEKVYKSDFMKEFLPTVGKNVGDAPTVCTYEKREALNNYVNLYANFRAKLLDAKAMGFDTMPELKSELYKYRRELAAPYLIDSSVLSALLHEAYERNHYSLDAAHILVHVRQDAAPEDTLAALQRIQELRRRVMDGEDFFAVASEEVHRVNPKAPNRPNEGELGYFTSFDMVYPFENAAYGLQVGEVSQPVRTRFGYHIVKLLDKVELQGKVSVAHIWLHATDSLKNKGLIHTMYQRLMDGTPFEEMARESDDRTTSGNGGLMPDVTLSQLPPEYIHAIEHMKVGEVSKPFFTQYGWHIVKLVSKEELAPYEDMVPYYKQKLARDQRGEASRKAFASNCRKKYKIVDLTQTPVPTDGKKRKKDAPVEMQASLDELISIVPDSVMSGLWRYKDTCFHDLRPLVQVPGKTYNVKDVASYIRKHQKQQVATKIDYYVKNHYQDFIDSVTIVYADSQIENENPEFAELVDEYRRGLMIFNYNDRMIWTKAIKDSAGFAGFYNRESQLKDMSKPEDSIYFWRMRARVVTYDVADSACLAPAKAKKILDKGLKKSLGSLEMRDALQKAMGKKCSGADAVKSSVDLVEQTHQNLLGDNQWSVGVYMVPQPKGYRALVVERVFEPMLKSQLEARGYYLSEYQNEVERNLNEELRKKYNVKINWDVVDDIVY